MKAYKPKWKLIKANYQSEVRNSGEEIKITSFYKVDEHIITTSPDYTKIFDKVLKVLKGTGISKITITFLDINLNPTPKEEDSLLTKMNEVNKLKKEEVR